MCGFVEQYRCTTALYLLSMLAHSYNIIIDHVAGVIGHVREFFDRLIATYSLMTTVKLPGSEAYYSHMEIHSSTANTDISLARGF